MEKIGLINNIANNLDKTCEVVMSQLTHEERMQHVADYLEASQSGDHEKAHRIAQQKPLTPWIAKGIKEIFGAEHLKGWDLSEAEAEYGKDWLNR